MSSSANKTNSKEKLFTIANQIDQTVKKAKKKAIVMVGRSKVGKSTCYNWVLKHPLQTREENRRVCYSPLTITNQTAKVASGFKSCTLVPNIVDLDEQTSLIDMQGFGDKRDYVGTLAVSYSLKAIFEAVESVKFILVITQVHLQSNDGNDLCQTINNFLSLFNFQKMPKAMKQELYHSTALLVTRSQHGIQHLGLLSQAKEILEDQDLKNVENRQEITGFLQHMLNFNRIDEFKMARLGREPQKCKIFDNYSIKHWNFFNIQNCQKLDAIQLPFQKQYKEMKPADQTSFRSAIEKRLQSYKGFSNIFVKMFEQILTPTTIHNIKLPYNSFFECIGIFLQENDHYDSKKYITFFDLNRDFFKPEKETLLKLIMKLNDAVELDIDFISHSQKIIAQKLTKTIDKLVDLIADIFCRNQNELSMILRIKYILKRGIREFYMLSKVDSQRVVSCFNEIHDGLEMILGSDFNNYLIYFLNCFDMKQSERMVFGQKNQNNVLQSYFNSRDSAFSLEILFKTHEDKIMNLLSQTKDQYFQILRDTKIFHAKYEYEYGNYKESCLYLLDAFNLQHLYEQNCINRVQYDLDQSKRSQLMESMMLNQENILEMIKENLIKMQKYKISLELAKIMMWVHSTCEIYQWIIASKDISKADLCNHIEEYADYCLNHNRKEKGVTLYQRLLELQKHSFARKKEINLLLRKCIDKSAQYQEKYQQFLYKYEQIDLTKPQRRSIVSQIQKELKDRPQLKRIIQLAQKRMIDTKCIKIDSQQDSKQILSNYLNERFINERIIDQNGFKVDYLQTPFQQQFIDKKNSQLCAKIDITNKFELEQMSKRLLQILEIESKRIRSQKQKVIVIELSKVTKNNQQISEKHLMITLNNQQIRPTFQYVFKTTKKIRKIVEQSYDKLTKFIQSSISVIQSVNSQINDYIFQRYYDSRQKYQQIQKSQNNSEIKSQESTKSEICRIIFLYYANSNASVDDFVKKYFEQFQNSVLVKTQLYEIFKFIKQSTTKDFSKDTLRQMGNDQTFNLSQSFID